MKNVNKDDFTRCPECGVMIKKENFYSHLINVHPDSEKTQELEEERQKDIEELKEVVDAISLLSDEKKTAQLFIDHIDEFKEEEEPEFWLDKGKAHFITEDYEEAKRSYEKAIEMFPENEAAEEELQQVEDTLELINKDDWDEDDIPRLKEELDEVIEAEFFKLGSHLSEQILKMRPDDVGARYQLAYSYMNRDELEKARENLEEVLEQEPSFIDALGNLALIYMKLGELDKAKKAYEEFMEERSDFAPGWNNLGMLYFNEDKYEKALETVQKSLDIDRNYAMGWFSKYQILRMMDREREAERCFDKAMDLNPQLTIQLAHNQGDEEKRVRSFTTNWGK